MTILGRRPPRPHARLAGGHRDRQQRVGEEVDRGDVAGAGPHRQAAHHPATGPRRPGRHAEVRLHRRPRRARAGLGPARRRPAVAAGAVAKALLASIGVEVVSHVVAARAGAGRDRPAAHAGRPRRGRRVAGAVLRSGGRGGHGRRDQGRRRPGRLARRRGRGARLRPAGRAGQPRPLGPQARRPAGPGAHEHPGGEGRRDRRRVRGGRPAGERGPRPDHAGTPTRAPTAATRPGPAGSRAA